MNQQYSLIDCERAANSAEVVYAPHVLKGMLRSLLEREVAKRQTKKESAVEAITSTAIGFVVALCAQVFIVWLYDIVVSPVQNVMITVFFTGVSIIRSYFVRRWFNWRKHK